MTFLNLGRMGRFANQMFSIAGTIGIAVQSGQSFAFPKWMNFDSEKFGVKEDIHVHKYFPNELPLVPFDMQIAFEEYPYFWGYRYINLPQGNINFNSHFQSPRYFDHAMDLVRHYFTMYDETTLDACAIHMRFGDYDGSYHPRPDPEYYKAAVRQMPRDTKFLLFSDDLTLAMDIMNELRVLYTPIDKDYLESFRLMKGCKHFICGNSSYSLMASILANQPGKRIVCPKKWFGDHVGLETVDLYPENSIVI